MPKYEYMCPKGHIHDEVRSIADRDAPKTCDGIFGLNGCDCGLKMKRVEIPAATPYVTRPGVGDRSPFSRDRVGK